MKKAGEKARSFIIHAAFIIIILLSAYFIISSTFNLTGYAVLDASTAKAKLQGALTSSSIFSQLQQASICVIINDPTQPISLEALKTSTGWEVAEMKWGCAGETAEDIMIQFSDYDRFSKMVDDPSPRNIANGAINREFEILPSRYVELGGNVICDATFRVKYCDSLKTMTVPEQLIDGDLACCIDKMTSDQTKLLRQHLEDGQFKDEIGILEQPSGGIFGFSMMTSIIALGGIVLVIILIAVIVLGKGKAKAQPEKPSAPTQAAPMMPASQTPYYASQAESAEVTELRNYVRQAIGQGYSEEEIRSHLLEIGWDAYTAEKVLTEAKS